jgi:hypothetical protein
MAEPTKDGREGEGDRGGVTRSPDWEKRAQENMEETSGPSPVGSSNP